MKIAVGCDHGGLNLKNEIIKHLNSKNIEIKDLSQKSFAYGSATDEKAYFVDVVWSYTDEAFTDYQKKATLIFIHDDIKLSLVELD